MSCRAALYAWTEEVATHLPRLTRPQAAVLALWSFGMVLARSCSLTAVSLMLAATLQLKEGSVRQRLREFTYEAAAKRGEKRRELEVEACFGPLLAWVVAEWEGRDLALALDASSLGDRFVVLAVSVLYRGCAIPVAWAVLPANRKGAWRPEWLRLLRLVWRAVPRDWRVIVLADRGLYARWLFRRIVRLGWHPFLRVNSGGTFRPEGAGAYRPLAAFAPRVGDRWAGRGVAFQGKERRLGCTLLACWGEGYADPWLVLTDLPPEAAEVGWYALRAWIEQGFKFAKRAGWQWQATRMRDPARAARLWLALAVATLWLLRVGGAAEDAIAESTLPEDAAEALAPPPRRRRSPRWRPVSVFRRGWTAILAALLNGLPLPTGRFRPEPWPRSPTPTPDHAHPVPI